MENIEAVGFVLTASDVASLICREVAELPDRNSPPEWPAAMLVTHAELHSIVLDAISQWTDISSSAGQPMPSDAAAPAEQAEVTLGAIQQIIDTVQRIKGGAENWEGGWSATVPCCERVILQLQIVSGMWERRNEDYANVVKQCAALAAQQAGGNDMRDAYAGAREDLLDWKRRALEAEATVRNFVREVNGPTFMGEPSASAPKCMTCGGSGWLGGPSFYNPGEGGEECLDCKGSGRASDTAAPAGGIPTEAGIAWQSGTTWPNERKAVTVEGHAWYRHDHPRFAANSHAPAAVRVGRVEVKNGKTASFAFEQFDGLEDGEHGLYAFEPR